MTPKTLQIANLYQVAAVAVFSVGALFLWPEAAIAVLAGGILMAANFFLLRTLLFRLVAQGGGSKATYAILLGFKFVGLMGGLTILVLVVEMHPLGLALGMVSMFVGVGLATLHQSLLTPASNQES